MCVCCVKYLYVSKFNFCCYYCVTRFFTYFFFKSHTYVHTYMYVCVYTYKQLISARQRRRSRQLLGPSRLAPQCDACIAATTSFQLLGFFLGRVQTVLPPHPSPQSQRPHNYAPDRNYEVLPTFNSLSKEEIVIAHVPLMELSFVFLRLGCSIFSAFIRSAA